MSRVKPLGDRMADCRGVADVSVVASPLEAPASVVGSWLETTAVREPYLWEKVRARADNWLLAGSGKRVMRWVTKGVPAYFNALGPPKPFNMGVSCQDLSVDEQQWLDREEKRCVQTGAWRRKKWLRYVSRAFIIPKPGLDAKGRKQYRLIVDLRPLNLHCDEFKTRYETLSRLCTVIRDGETVAFLSFDVKDAYHCLQIDDTTPQPDGSIGFQQYFGFSIQGRLYVCGALPFGWNGSPYVFNTAMKTLTRLCRAESLPTAAAVAAELQAGRGKALRSFQGLRVGDRSMAMAELSEEAVLPSRVPWHVLPYCDDYLLTVKGESPEERLENGQRAARVAEEAIDFLGLERHPTKGQWLEQGDGLDKLRAWIHHLGLKVDTTGGNGEFSVTLAKLAKVKKSARGLRGIAGRNRRLVGARRLAQFLGLVQSLQLAVEPAQMFQRAMHEDLKQRTSWSSNVRLSRQSLRDLTVWIDVPLEWNGAPIARSTVTRLLYSDASEFAVGGMLATVDVPAPETPGLDLEGPRWHRALTLEEQQQGIFIGEVRALVETVENFAPEVSGHTVRFMEDNQAAMYATRRLTSKHPVAMPLLRRLWALLCVHRIRLQDVDYVRSAENPADEPSRWRFFDEWRLCPRVFQRVCQELGTCSLDLFASKNTAQLPRYCSRFRDPEAVATDAWSVKWAGERLWINADWDWLERIAQRLESEPGAAATIVCPYFPVQSWFQRLAALADRILVCPWEPVWASRPQRRECGQIGPADWSVCFVSVPVRRPGPSSVLRCVDQSVASVVSVEALLQAVALPGSTLNDPDGT